MKNLFLFLLISVSIPSFAQYYYKDIISSAEDSRTMKTFVLNKVVTVTATGYDADGVKTNDFA